MFYWHWNTEVVSLTYWGRVTHTCVGNLTTIGSGNGLSSGRRQAITWTNVGILLIGPLGTNLSDMLIEIHIFSFKKIHLKMSYGKWRPFCLGLNVFNERQGKPGVHFDTTEVHQWSTLINSHLSWRRFHANTSSLSSDNKPLPKQMLT